MWDHFYFADTVSQTSAFTLKIRRLKSIRVWVLCYLCIQDKFRTFYVSTRVSLALMRVGINVARGNRE